MKEIGEKLKETRESMDITIEEAATDLKIQPIQIENIEEGNKEAFNDIYFLKMFIKNYSKYLGLNDEEMIEDFNDYLFDFTSKISIDDIKAAEKKHKKQEKKLKSVKISSPYTMEKRQQYSVPRLLIIGGIVIGIIIAIYIIVLVITKDKEETTNTIVDSRGVVLNEFA